MGYFLIIVFLGLVISFSNASANLSDFPFGSGTNMGRSTHSNSRGSIRGGKTGFVQPSKPYANGQNRPRKKPQAKDQVFTSLDPLNKLKERVYSRKANASFFNSDFDDYSSVSAKGPKADYVSGYDRNYADGSSARRYNLGMQYSHTYDGHEPWDDCLPKEKDPWDKDFYTN